MNLSQLLAIGGMMGGIPGGAMFTNQLVGPNNMQGIGQAVQANQAIQGVKGAVSAVNGQPQGTDLTKALASFQPPASGLGTL